MAPKVICDLEAPTSMEVPSKAYTIIYGDISCVVSVEITYSFEEVDQLYIIIIIYVHY